MTQTAVKEVKNYIGGKWVEANTDKTEAVYNPATGEVIANVPVSTKEDVDHAVQVASEAFQSWKEVAVPKRARILFKYQQLLVDNWEELAKIITIENGKSYAEAYGEVQRGIENVEFAAGAPSLMMGEQLPSIATELESGVYRYPIGVIGGITPFNFPMMVPCWMFRGRLLYDPDRVSTGFPAAQDFDLSPMMIINAIDGTAIDLGKGY